MQAEIITILSTASGKSADLFIDKVSLGRFIDLTLDARIMLKIVID